MLLEGLALALALLSSQENILKTELCFTMYNTTVSGGGYIPY